MSSFTSSFTCLALAAAASALGAAGCKSKSEKYDQAPAATTVEQREMGHFGGAASTPAAPPAPEPAMEMDRRFKNNEVSDPSSANAAQKVPADGITADKPDDGKEEEGEKRGGKRVSRESPARSWFPETFLFEPLVVTDDTGAATVSARVPDRLTSWRVLALAHSRSGAQGGAVASFLGTLPTYVDPVVPKVLVVGDDLRVPIQIVNTTAAPVSARLTLAAERATFTGPAADLTVAAGASRVEYARLTATTAGRATLKVAMGETDAVIRTVEVVSPGRPVVTTRTGTLAAPRTLTLPGIPGADPATDRVRLLAYPGALALLRSELGAATARTGVPDDAYALLLAGRATKLLTALGEKPDPAAIRELSILATQRAIRDARTFDVPNAALLAEAALAHPDNPVLQRLGARAGEYLGRAQRPDGTFSGGAGWTVQRVLIATADATRAIASATTTPADARRAAAAMVRAAGAFERNAVHIEDAYTAAAVLASGAIKGKLADELKAKVKAAIQATEDGAKVLPVGEGVVRADGSAPSQLEATALAVLALQGDADAPLADLGASLLGGYDFRFGWGDGHTNLIALRAVLELFDNPLPDRVTLKLLMDGAQIAEGVLSGEKLREMVTLEAPAPGLATAHEWKLVAEPAVPGLGFSLSLHSWVPWEKQTATGGVELKLPTALTGSVGDPLSIELSAAAPAGLPLHIQHALPAGVTVDRQSLEALVSTSVIARFEVADNRVDLYVNPLEPGRAFVAKYRVIPTIAGKLHTTASLFEAGSTVFHVPPTTWTIK